ncbi:MAG: hypothetical protein J6U52_05790 [Alistipes sp.]|nr:hypothetical protein [Alistipes sp.]
MTEDYESKYTGEEIDERLDKVGNKQDIIAELDDIRRGAGKGTTAVQKVKINGKELAPSNGVVNLGNVVTELTNYYSKREVDSAIASAITTTLNTPV